MADIELSCPKCSKTITVSQFVDHDKLICSACGSPFKAPEAEVKKEKPALRKLAIAAPPPPQESTENLEPTKWQVSQQAAKDKQPKRKFEMSHLLWSTIIFFVLGGILGYLRYCGGYLAEHRDLVRTYGPIIIISVHVIILLKAFKDSVFVGALLSGVLCFQRCDSFFKFLDFFPVTFLNAFNS